MKISIIECLVCSLFVGCVCFFFGMKFERGRIQSNPPTCEINFHLKRSLDGCEAVAKQCLDDVQSAEYRLKICMGMLEQYYNPAGEKEQ